MVNWPNWFKKRDNSKGERPQPENSVSLVEEVEKEKSPEQKISELKEEVNRQLGRGAPYFAVEPLGELYTLTGKKEYQKRLIELAAQFKKSGSAEDYIKAMRLACNPASDEEIKEAAVIAYQEGNIAVAFSVATEISGKKSYKDWFEGMVNAEREKVKSKMDAIEAKYRPDISKLEGQLKPEPKPEGPKAVATTRENVKTQKAIDELVTRLSKETNFLRNQLQTFEMYLKGYQAE